MYTLEQVGEKLPVAVLYDVDNTAVPHGAALPSEETVDALGRLSNKGVEVIPITGRDIDDCEETITALRPNIAIISGGAITLCAAPMVGGEHGFDHAWRFGFDLGKPLDDADVMGLNESVGKWLQEHPSEVAAYVRNPVQARQDQWFSGRTEDMRFIDPACLFVSNLSCEAVANDLVEEINAGHHHFRPLHAVKVTSQDGRPEIQITRSQANKKFAIEEAVRQILPCFRRQQIPQNAARLLAQSVFIGDGLNDLPAFEAVGFGVAMADAPQVVLDAADHAIPSQKDNGFVQFLHKIALAES